MNLINLKTLEYPRSLWQVRQANPNVSFPAEPTDDDLAPFDHANVHPSPQPTEYNQRTQRVEEGTPILIDDRYQQVWQLRPATQEELAAWDVAHAPEPDWERFQEDLQIANGFPAAWGAIFSGDPRPGIGLISALLDWRATGQWAPFFGAALACLALLPPEQAAHVGLELLALATDCHLDPAFCQALETFLEASS